MDAVEHGRIVLSAIFAHKSRKALDMALRRLQPAHFVDSVQRNLFLLAERYLDQAGGVLSREALADAMRTQPPGTAQMYQEYYDLVSGAGPSADQFRWSVEQLRELAADRATGETLAQAMEILTRGAMDGKTELRGHADSRTWLLSKLAEIDRELHQQDAPEGDMRTEQAPILAEYAERQRRSLSGGTGVATGIAGLDKVLGGGTQRGELDLIAAYTSAGKSSFCAQVAWHACTVQRKNVVIFTSETLRPQVRVKILARHSLNFGAGLNTRDIKAGTLSPEGQDTFLQVVSDFTSNQEYGRCYIAQVPRGATLGTVEARLARVGRQFPVDLVIIDYLALLRPDRRRTQIREELADVIKEAKLMAATYNDGAGVPVISPWQIGRAARDRAIQEQMYSTLSLAETSEASSTADVIISLLEPEDSGDGRHVELKCQVLKNRDGEQLPSMKLIADYATCCFTEHSTGLPQDGDMDAMLALDGSFG